MFSRLNWKLTFSYTLVTVGTLLVLELCALLGFQLLASSAALGWTVGGMLQAEALPQVRRSALRTRGGQSDRLGSRLQAWFPAPGHPPSEAEILPLSPDGLASPARPQGRLLAKRPNDPEFDPQRIPGLTQTLPAALQGAADLTQLTWREGDY
jgi:hypothetical protein